MEPIQLLLKNTQHVLDYYLVYLLMQPTQFVYRVDSSHLAAGGVAGVAGVGVAAEAVVSWTNNQ